MRLSLNADNVKRDNQNCDVCLKVKNRAKSWNNCLPLFDVDMILIKYLAENII